MADIRITYGDLDAAVAELGFVTRQLAASDRTSAAAAEAVGHDGLAASVLAFADTWDDNRERHREAADALAERIAGIATGFRETDRQLAAG
ncbi:hypothetical protein [Agrococcus sp. Marseille-Q4369]|uniref:hypothetical protein n=1 Tax=Agrococcus sp. Marseille-Q4369 TaxID=2810513 RepID=UPI001B8CC9DF|nr:hypothetical protein [Agrococcus sp. Marseille-Q4369]QUW17682.1 hypothetical protein JSQ78_07225 [Agrococcus sp. Marseille-Q4369]